MKSGAKVTREELIECIGNLKQVFDVVRIVDPYCVHVLDETMNVQDKDSPCYRIWGKNRRCTNCISLKAYVDFKRMTKYEFREENAVFVMVMPFMVTDEDNRIVVVEMLNDVSEEIQVRTAGDTIVAQTISHFDKELYTDSLTGVYNRRYFDENMFVYKTNDVMSKRVGFIICDLKHFKHINDTYGHLAGDLVLKKAAEVMASYTRDTDAVIRLGGDEFLIIMQDCTEEGVKDTVKRIKEKFETVRIPEIPDDAFEINAGYSYMEDFNATKRIIESMAKVADHHMYEDKQGE